MRVQSSILNINIRQSTNIKVSIQKWNLSRNSLAFRDYLGSPEGRKIFRKIEEIRLTIDERIISGKGVTAEEVKRIVHEVVYRECLQRDFHKVTLSKYMDSYLEQAETGKRKTQKGLNFSAGTIKSIRAVRKLLIDFQSGSEKLYDFDDKDYEFRTRFIDFMKEKGILTVFHYIPLHSAPAGVKYGRFHGEDEYTTKESERLVRLPMYYSLTLEEVDQISNAVKEFYA